ncbi:MAG: hypothetical protein WBX25_03950 [Rhodomicrobium sp.]
MTLKPGQHIGMFVGGIIVDNGMDDFASRAPAGPSKSPGVLSSTFGAFFRDTFMGGDAHPITNHPRRMAPFLGPRIQVAIGNIAALGAET